MTHLLSSARAAAGAVEGCGVRAPVPVDLGKQTAGCHLPQSAFGLPQLGCGRRRRATVASVRVGLMIRLPGHGFNVTLNSHLRFRSMDLLTSGWASGARRRRQLSCARRSEDSHCRQFCELLRTNSRDPQQIGVNNNNDDACRLGIQSSVGSTAGSRWQAHTLVRVPKHVAGA
jgi:hypothetical protein